MRGRDAWRTLGDAPRAMRTPSRPYSVIVELRPGDDAGLAVKKLTGLMGEVGTRAEMKRREHAMSNSQKRRAKSSAARRRARKTELRRAYHEAHRDYAMFREGGVRAA